MTEEYRVNKKIDSAIPTLVAILLACTLGALILLGISNIEPTYIAPQEQTNKLFSFDKNGNATEVIAIDVEEAKWMWQASNGVLDQFAEVRWANPSSQEEQDMIDKGYFLFGHIYMPQMWWLNMSEEERELRVTILNDCKWELCVSAFNKQEYEQLCDTYGVGK